MERELYDFIENNPVYTLTETSEFSDTILGYSMSKPELENLMNMMIINDVYDYKYSIDTVNEITVNKEAQEEYSSAELVTYEKGSIVFYLDETKDENGFFAYLVKETRTAHRNVFKDSSKEWLKYHSYSLGQNEIYLTFQSENYTEILEKCRDMKLTYELSGLSGLLKDIKETVD